MNVIIEGIFLNGYAKPEYKNKETGEIHQGVSAGAFGHLRRILCGHFESVQVLQKYCSIGVHMSAFICFHFSH